MTGSLQDLHARAFRLLEKEISRLEQKQSLTTHDRSFLLKAVNEMSRAVLSPDIEDSLSDLSPAQADVILGIRPRESHEVRPRLTIDEAGGSHA